MDYLLALKDRVGTRVAGAVGDPRLGRVLERIVIVHPGSDPEKRLDLAHAEVCLMMATDAALYFKYSQGSESVDKTATPGAFLTLAKTLWAKHGVERGGGVRLVRIGRSRRTEEL